MKTGDYENYLKFYAEFGEVLKEGIGTDFSNRERVADLLLVSSTKTEPGKFTTLDAYVQGMKPEQKEIVYLVGGEPRADRQQPRTSRPPRTAAKKCCCLPIR